MKTLVELFEDEHDALRSVKIAKAELNSEKRKLRDICRTIYEYQQLKLFDDSLARGATVTELRRFVKGEEAN